MAHFLLLRACSYLWLFTSLRDFWFVVSRELIKEVLDKAPPTSDALNFLFLLLQSIVLIVHNPCRLLAITCKLAMELKQGTRSKGQTRREEGMYEGWKRRRVMFICHKEKIKVWDRLDNLLRNKERVERTGWWWFYTARIHIHCFFFQHVCDSVKFPMTKNLWSLPQAYPSINHWWSIIFATLRSLGRVGPIFLNMRTWYTIAASWHTFTNIYFWSLTLRERPESIMVYDA